MSDPLELVEIPCPLCRSSDHRFFLKAKDYAHGIGGEFTLVRCRACGHVYLNPAPTADSLAACYPEDYAQHRDQQAASTVQSEAVASTEEDVAPLETASRPWYLSAPVRKIPGLRAAYYWMTDRKSQCFPPVEPAGRAAARDRLRDGRVSQTTSGCGLEGRGAGTRRRTGSSGATARVSGPSGGSQVGVVSRRTV